MVATKAIVVKRGDLRRGLVTRRTDGIALVARENAALEVAADMAMEKASKARRAVAVMAKGVGGIEKLYEAAKNKQSRVHVATKDGLGMLSGIVSFESVNWLLRKMETNSPRFAENTDYWQSIPHLIIGTIVYWAELLSRKPDAAGFKVFPSMPREVASEWSKAFALLGASNLWRALRLRRKDNKKALEQKAALEVEVATLREKLEKLDPSQKES